MLLVERTIGLPDGKDQVEELAHAVSHGNVTSLALGPEAAIEVSAKVVVNNFRRLLSAFWQLRSWVTRSPTNASATGPRREATDCPAA